MKRELNKKDTKVSIIIQNTLFLRFSPAETNRLLVLLKLLKIKDKEAKSSFFWRKLYQNYPNIFDFVMEK